MSRFVIPSFALALVLMLAGCGGPGVDASISGTLVYPGSTSAAAATQALPMLGGPGGDSIVLAKRNDLHAHEPLRVVPGEVLVRFAAGVRAQSVGSMDVGGTRLELARTVAMGAAGYGLYRAAGLDQRGTLALVDEVRARPDVIAAHPNWILHALKVPNDPGYAAQWHYEAMNLPAAWDIEDGTTNTVPVAVVDTGFVAHPDLVGNIVGGYDFVSDTANSGDGDGPDADATDMGGRSDFHGSHVAGTIAAVTDNADGVAGVSWGARIEAVRVLGTDGSGSFDDILNGVSWAAGGSVPGAPNNPNPAWVINMSLGADIGQACPSDIGAFFQDLANAGVIVVVAAGNDGQDAATTFPANCPGVVTVGATGPRNERAPYSNFGSVVDVMATGGDVSQSFTVGGQVYPAGVLSTVAQDNGNGTLSAAFAFYQGTSMAAPHIAGIVALMLSQDPSLTFQSVLSGLEAAATPLSAGACHTSSGGDCGAGLVDAAAALNAGGAGGGTPPPPPPPPPPTQNLTTYVAALRCTSDACSDFDLDQSQLVSVQVTSNTVPFTVPGLQAGTFAAAAWQDTDGDQQVDTGEPFGVYQALGGDIAIRLGAGQQVDNVLIVMEPLTSARAGTPAPSPAKAALEALMAGRSR